MSAFQSILPPAPPKAKPVQYKAPLGTRWEKEKAAAPKGTFDFPEDPNTVGPWVIGECVGKGASGRVKIARHTVSGIFAAVKILPLEAVLSSRLSMRSRDAKAEKHRNGIDKEIIMMKLMDHPNIVRILDVYEGEKELFLILEYVDGGELFDYLVNHGRMDLLQALRYFKQIVYGLNYAHAFSIIHRDLKPENILIKTLDPPHVKIADWGMAAFAPPSHQLETSCGSPHYASPEIVNGKRYSGTATDIWSCGVILFALMTGRLPFDDKNIKNLLAKVKSGRYEIPSYVHPEAADLIRRMLVVDVQHRITMTDILVHPFLQHETPGIVYEPAPSIAELDRPLRAKACIKQDLLRSLLVICAGTTVDELISELLSPAGQGSLIKALYFLLAKHRERTLEEYAKDVIFNDENNIRHYMSPPPKEPSALGQISVSRKEGDDLLNVRASRIAPSPPSASPSATPSSTLAPTPAPSCANSQSIVHGPFSTVGPKAPHVHSAETQKENFRPISTPVLPTNLNDVFTELEAKGDGAHATQGRKARPRTQTISSARPDVTTFQPSAIETPMIGSPRVNPVVPIIPPFNVDADAQWVIKPPTVENKDLQRAMEDIAGRFTLLVARDSQKPNCSTAVPIPNQVETARETTDQDRRTRRKKSKKVHRTKAKESSREFSNGNTNKRTVDLSRNEGAATVTIVEKNKENSRASLTSSTPSVDGGFTKIDIVEKVEPPAISENMLQRVVSRMSKPAPPEGSMQPEQSLTSHIVSTAVVGEFKGWFANLFNWKAQQYVLHSVDNCLTTRDEVTRLLELFGCNVSLEDAQGWGVLKCRVEDSHDLETGAVLKPVRFRVEFSPVIGYVLPPTRRSTMSAAPRVNPLSSKTSAPSRMSMKNATSFASTIVLVQEKGALSTFKHIYQRLRAEWRLDALHSPELGGGTPMISATPKLR